MNYKTVHQLTELTFLFFFSFNIFEKTNKDRLNYLYFQLVDIPTLTVEFSFDSRVVSCDWRVCFVYRYCMAKGGRY